MKDLTTLVLFPIFAGSVHTEAWVDWDDFVVREGVDCKKFNDIPSAGTRTWSREPTFVAL